MSEEEDIPFKYVGTGILTKLANKLDPLNHVNGNDWRLLAEKLGYSQDEIQVIEEQKHLDGRSTIKLLNNYIKKTENSVEKVLKALEEMPRVDALTILQEAVPKIREFARQKKEEEDREEGNSFSPYTPSDYYRSNPWAWSGMIPHMPPMAHMPPYYMSHPGIPFDPPYASHGSPLNINYPNHYTRSFSQNGFLGMPPPPTRNGHPGLTPSPPVYNMNNGYPEIPGRDFHSMKVNHSMYPDRQVSREISDSGHHYREDPAPLARTIFKNQGHPFLSTNTRPQRSQSAEYNGDVSDDDSLSTGSDPASPNNNRRHGHVTNDVRNDILDDIGINIRVQFNRNVRNDASRVCEEDSKERNKNNVNCYVKQTLPVFNIKVFVTYAKHSEKHIQRVLSLCRCLEKNKFYVFKENGKDDNLENIKREFEEADFVLVCSSKTFKEDFKDGNHSNSKIDGLHTKFIYELIYDEFKEKRNHRCVPVILDGTSQSDIPTWLQSTMKYIWPSQYQDLLKFLFGIK